MPVTVIKVGGSLLALPDLPARLGRLISAINAVVPADPASSGDVASGAGAATAPGHRPGSGIRPGSGNNPGAESGPGSGIRPGSPTVHQILIVPGGGTAADVVRNWDSIYHLSLDDSHWLAIESLSLTARLLATLLPNAVVANSRQAAAEHFQSGRIVILEPRALLLEITRQTGDDLPHNWDVTSDSIAAWIALHWPADQLILAKSVAPAPDAVDPFFGTLQPRLRSTGWCNLRDAPDIVQTVRLQEND